MRPVAAAPALLAEGLAHGYGFRAVLRGVDLRLEAGEVLAVFGPNGAGKSTLLRLLAGLVPPQAGSIAWWGRAMGERTPRIGLIGHRSYLFDELTAEENLAYYGRLLGLPAPEASARAAIAAEGLALHARRPVGTLSRGTSQRLAICRAWLGAPRLVLADEPATGLDPEAARRLHLRLAELRGAGGAAVLVAHDLGGALRIADRYVILAGGRIVAEGAAEPWRGRLDAFADLYARAAAAGQRQARARAPLPPVGRGRAGGPAPDPRRGRSPWPAVGAVLERETRLWWRGRDRLGAVAAFGLLVALIFGFALDPTVVNLRPVLAGVVWTGLLFAGLPAFGRSMVAEWENDAMDGYRATGADPAALFYGKCLANLGAFACAEVVLVPAFLAILQVPPQGAGLPALLALVLGTLGFVAAGSLIGAIAGRALGPGGGGLLPLLALPLLAPVILGTVRVVQGSLDAAPLAQEAWLLMLLVYAALFWFLPWILFPVVAEA